MKSNSHVAYLYYRLSAKSLTGFFQFFLFFVSSLPSRFVFRCSVVAEGGGISEGMRAEGGGREGGDEGRGRREGRRV